MLSKTSYTRLESKNRCDFEVGYQDIFEAYYMGYRIPCPHFFILIQA